MAKQLLKERLQELAGIRPLYGLDESAEADHAYDAWQSTLSKIKDNDEALEYAAKHFGVNKDELGKILSSGNYGEPLNKLQALNKDPKWKSFTDTKPSEPEPEKKKPGFLGKMFGKK